MGVQVNKTLRDKLETLINTLNEAEMQQVLAFMHTLRLPDATPGSVLAEMARELNIPAEDVADIMRGVDEVSHIEWDSWK